ncbi:unnamed protein product [Rotaria sordida]|uniref:Uncharacterized protein n=2 Tax=Rotaria sordida TaxID=392033 RepID=A0A820C1Q7_9BILA|nr:unnamed protein product [Rotaria sordida]CAF4201638.1 unnamed protein product [Rotaria sordida]
MKCKAMLLFLFSVLNILSINEDDLPTSLLLKSFDLQILTQCDVDSLDIILRCMPNLREFTFTFIVGPLDTPYYNILLDGNNWQQVLTSRVPYLNKFDFHMSFYMFEESFNLDLILNSFRCFVTQYDDWHMAISRWKTFQEPISCKLMK